MSKKNGLGEECPVCHDEFYTEDSFKKHIQIHTDESVLSKPIEPSEEIDYKTEINYQTINLDKIFDKERIEELIERKIKTIDNNDELINSRIFIEEFKKINRKSPLLYLPYFIEDFINGMNAKQLRQKYHISSDLDYYSITHDILKFTERRYRFESSNEDTRKNNLSIISWEEKYKTIEKNCNFFEDEINLTILYNMLQAQIILSLMDKPLEKDQIINECRNIKNNFDIFRFTNEKLEKKFSDFINEGLNEKISEIIRLLLDEKIIVRNRTHPKQLAIIFDVDKLKESILFQLDQNDNKQQLNILRTLMLNEYPVLRLLPELRLYQMAVDELKEKKIIHLEPSNRGWSTYEVFLTNEYLQLQNKIKSLDDTGLQIPFKGRKITPERFIEELLELDKGDFDDADDQITRLAGLVLAESVKLQSVHEDIPEFDFSINLKNYHFSEEQEEAMEKLDFTINSEIFHIKVMVDQILNLKKYGELKEKLPPNEQCVVITFKKIPLNVKKLLENDSSIQIIDEDGVKIWVSITSRLPARVNSICEISSDPLSKLENKLVKVNSVFYETGFALVSIIPEMNEVTVLARCLEEIPLFESKPSDFNLYSKNYLEFLIILSTITTHENLFDGFFKNKFIEEPTGNETQLDVYFDYNTVNLDLSAGTKYSAIKCNCIQYAENSLYLCPHLVSALDYMFRRFSFADESWPDSNDLKNTLNAIITKNIEIILDRLVVLEENGEIQEDSTLSDFVFGMNKIKSTF